MATQSERRASTRAAIIDAAAALFGSKGYNGTSLSAVQSGAGVSRGALYHHFSSKQDVLATVFVRTSAAAIRRSAKRVPSTATPFEALTAGCLGWLTVTSEPEIAQILLVDGPTALGWERCRTLEEATSLGVMRSAIAAAADSGEIEVASVDLTARLINALLAEAALTLQRSPTRTAKRHAKTTITAMLNGLKTTPVR